MKALSVRQPWAHCLLGTRAGRRKRFVLRNWAPRPYGVAGGDRFAIHATAKQGPATWDAIERVLGPMVFGYDGCGKRDAILVSSGERLRFGVLLGTVRLRRVWHVQPIAGGRSARLSSAVEEKDEIVELTIGPDAGFGDRAWWAASRLAWELDEPIRYDEPRPARGHQGLWTVPDNL